MTGAERVAIDVEAVTAEPASDAFLSVRDLQVHFPTEDGIVKAVNGINPSTSLAARRSASSASPARASQ